MAGNQEEPGPDLSRDQNEVKVFERSKHSKSQQLKPLTDVKILEGLILAQSERWRRA